MKKASIERLPDLPSIDYLHHASAKDQMIWLHFFSADSDWYVAALDSETRRFYGYVVPNRSLLDGHWGWHALETVEEAASQPNVHRDERWVPRRAVQVARIRQAYEAQGKW